MSCPQAHSSLWPLPHASRDEIQRHIPAHTAPGICAAILANLGAQQSSRIAKNLVGAAAAHAKKAMTVRIVLFTAAQVAVPRFNN